GSPGLDHALRLGQAAELLEGEQLVANARAEGLDIGVLPRRARVDVGAPCLREAAPVLERVGRELRAVVAADALGRAAAEGDEAVERGDGLIGVDPPATLDRKRLARELVDDVQQLQDVTVGSLVKLEVK